MRKILRIDTGLFLYDIHPDRVETCNHIKGALDISELSFEAVSNLTHNLYNAGYKNLKVMEVK